MEIQRILTDSDILAEQGWKDIAGEMIAWNWGLSNEAELHGEDLARMVVYDRLSLKDLRAGVSWANAAELEAIEKFDGDIFDLNFSKADRTEALARRVAHHAGRWALGQVKTQRRRTNFFVEQQKQLRQNINANSGTYSSRIRIIG